MLLRHLALAGSFAFSYVDDGVEVEVARLASLVGLGSRGAGALPYFVLRFHSQVVTMAGYAIMAASSGGHCDIFCLQAPARGSSMPSPLQILDENLQSPRTISRQQHSRWCSATVAQHGYLFQNHPEEISPLAQIKEFVLLQYACGHSVQPHNRRVYRQDVIVLCGGI